MDEIAKPVGITRYRSYLHDPARLGSNPTEEEVDAVAKERDNESVTVTNGLYYKHEQSNGGGVWVVYDRNRKRAFYHHLMH